MSWHPVVQALCNDCGERSKTQRTQAVDTVKLCESNIKRATTLRNEYQAILNATRP